MNKLYSQRIYVHSSDGLNGVLQFPATVELVASI